MTAVLIVGCKPYSNIFIVQTMDGSTLLSRSRTTDSDSTAKSMEATAALDAPPLSLAAYGALPTAHYRFNTARADALPNRQVRRRDSRGAETVATRSAYHWYKNNTSPDNHGVGACECIFKDTTYWLSSNNSCSSQPFFSTQKLGIEVLNSGSI